MQIEDVLIAVSVDLQSGPMKSTLFDARYADAMNTSKARALSFALCAVLLAGCASDDASNSASTAPRQEGSTVAPIGTGATVARDPVESVSTAPASPEALERASRAIESVRAQLPYTGAEVTCLVDTVARSSELLDRIDQGFTRESPAFSDVVRLGQVCVQRVTFAPQFAQGVQDQSDGALTAEQVRCLAEKYAGLSTEVLLTMTEAAVDGTAVRRAELAAQLDALIVACGVPLPK